MMEMTPMKTFRILAAAAVLFGILSAPAFAQTPRAQDAVISATGKNSIPGTQVSMTVTTADSPTTTYNATVVSGGAFTLPSAALENQDNYVLGFTVPYSANPQGRGVRETLNVNFIYDYESDDLILRGVLGDFATRATITYTLPGETVARSTVVNGSRFDIVISDYAGIDNLGVSTLNMKFLVNLGGTTMADPVEITATITPTAPPNTGGGGGGGGIGLPGGVLAGLSGLVAQTYIADLQDMTRQATKSSQSQVSDLSALTDNSRQYKIETHRRARKADTENNLRPSNRVCEMATLSSNIQSSEEISEATQAAASQDLFSKMNNRPGTITGDGEYESLKRHITEMCDNGQLDPSTNGVSGLKTCPEGMGDQNYSANTDAYARLVAPKTIPANLSDTDVTAGDKNTMALLSNLTVITLPESGKEEFNTQAGFSANTRLDSVRAKQSLVYKAVTDYAAEKSMGPGGPAAAGMKKMYLDNGVAPADVESYVGNNPSKYAQEDVLMNKSFLDAKSIADTQETHENVLRNRAVTRNMVTKNDLQILERMEMQEMLLAAILTDMVEKEMEYVTDKIIRK